MSKFNPYGPFQQIHGKPTTYDGILRGYTANRNVVRVRHNNQNRLFFADTGEHIHGELPRLQNAAPVLDTTAPLQTRAGTPVKLEGVLPDGRLVIVVQYDFGLGNETKIVPASGRSGGGGSLTEHSDDIINKPVVPVARFFNLYADGTKGGSSHATLYTAKRNSKYGKVRVGILKQELVNGLIVKAEVIPTDALKRTSANPFGQLNPWA